MILALLVAAYLALLASPVIYWVATKLCGYFVGYGLAGVWYLQYERGWR